MDAERLDALDRVIVEFDRALRTVFAPARGARPMPGADLPGGPLDEAQRRHVEGLLRVDHTGEICAQALYQGQALTSRDPSIREALRSASDEEVDHLAWTEARLHELGGRTSLLDPLWYLGSLAIGVAAGAAGTIGISAFSPRPSARSSVISKGICRRCRQRIGAVAPFSNR